MLFSGFDRAAASVTWNGGSYLVAWRHLGQFFYGTSIPQSFLALTHVHPDGSFDPIATTPTGIWHNLDAAPPALSVNMFGTELIVIDEIRQFAGSPRAVAYVSSEVADHVKPPTTPVITSVRPGPDGVTLTWNRTSDNERGFVIRLTIAASSVPGLIVVPAGTSSVTVPEDTSPITFTLSAWNEAGVSETSKITFIAPRRTVGRR